MHIRTFSLLQCRSTNILLNRLLGMTRRRTVSISHIIATNIRVVPTNASANQVLNLCGPFQPGIPAATAL